jgi:hypothetical protein
MDSVLHKVLSARKLTPIEKKEGFTHRLSSNNGEEEGDKEEIPKLLLRDKIEKELQSWTEGNKKDVMYLLGQKLFFSKDPIARAEAWRQLNKIIEYYEDPNSP